MFGCLIIGFWSFGFVLASGDLNNIVPIYTKKCNIPSDCEVKIQYDCCNNYSIACLNQDSINDSSQFVDCLCAVWNLKNKIKDPKILEKDIDLYYCWCENYECKIYKKELITEIISDQKLFNYKYLVLWFALLISVVWLSYYLYSYQHKP